MNTRRMVSWVLLAGLVQLTGQQASSAPLQSDDPPGPNKRNGFIFIPAVFYTPETEFAGGVSVIYYFRPSDSRQTDRPSIIQPTFIYTQKDQILTDLSTDLYWRQGLYRLKGGIGYRKYPDKFYGIGPKSTDAEEEDFTPKIFSVSANFYKRMRPGLNMGLLFEYRHDTISKVEESGLLSSGLIPGSRGGRLSGLGLLANWDTRDNIFYPTQGAFHQFSAASFGSGLGSDFDFARYVVDLRLYKAMTASAVLALQGIGRFMTGSPPLQSLTLLGGSNVLRGYYEGRYRDRHGIVVQGEYRQRVFGRFGLVGFLGFGAVAPERRGFRLRQARTSAGLGVRYLYSRSEGINIRIDFGFIGGTPGPYITINEAF